jgi:hypothetical protein
MDICWALFGRQADGTTTTMTLAREGDGRWDILDYNCAAPIAPSLTGTYLREQAQRLVPHPAIGTVPADGYTLVNIQTVLWLDTAPTRSLGTLRLLGHRVELRVSVSAVRWDFGDGGTVTADVGLPYSDARPCDTALCPGYFGHVYRTTGARTVTATVTWSGRYRVDGGGWQQIAGGVAGPASTLDLRVKQARGVLVGDPGP